MEHQPPGAWRVSKDVWGPIPARLSSLKRACVVLVDERVLRLHPALAPAIQTANPLATVPLKAGEGAKSLRTLERVSASMHALPRSGAILCIGGGTLGDMATVAAHLCKRGVDLIQVPSTLLAAVDSSLGGKGAVHVGKTKNALGAFHYAAETWLCPELWTTLGKARTREGLTEAYKMAICLNPTIFSAWELAAPNLEDAVRQSRAMKETVCLQDPYDATGTRRVLNFGHTFGHVLETLSNFRISHGDAVGLGMLCALDVGEALGITSKPLSQRVTTALEHHVGILPRSRMAAVFSQHDDAAVGHILAADKKGAGATHVKMVLLEDVGATRAVDVPLQLWSRLAAAWRVGRAP